MQIMVQLEAALARAAREGAPQARAVLDLVAAAGATLRPVHPTVDAPPLSTWFTASLPSHDAARVAAMLAALPGVTAAYVKPQDALP